MGHVLVYGGTFDPIHFGHLRPCAAARELLGADVVLLIPAGVSPHKLADVAAASGADRLAMVELAIAGEAGFAVDGRELARSGPSYTVDTILALKAERPGDVLTLLIGADQLGKLHTWHRMGEIAAAAGLAVMRRAGWTAEDVAEAAGRLGMAAGRLPLLETPLVDVSATEIRRRVRDGEGIGGLVPAGVAAYIREKGLYRG